MFGEFITNSISGISNSGGSPCWDYYYSWTADGSNITWEPSTGNWIYQPVCPTTTIIPSTIEVHPFIPDQPVDWNEVFKKLEPTPKEPLKKKFRRLLRPVQEE